MGSWKARASVASVTGACVFALVTGAGAVFVGDWWGQHHGPVVTVFVTPPASASRASHATVARSAHPAAQAQRTSTGGSVAAPGGGDAQADANAAQVAQVTPRAPGRHHPAKPSGPAPATPGRTTAPATVASATPSGTETGPAPVGASAPVITSSPVS